jgi:hypothetical protein
LSIVILGFLIGLPGILCGTYCCCTQQCASCRIKSFPVVADLVFEVVHSRTLAIIEATAFFMLMPAIYLDTRMCESSFSIDPQVTTNVFTNDLSSSVDANPAKSVHFRDDDDLRRCGVVALALFRFVLTNLSNSKWQQVGDNLSGAALIAAVVFSMWSLIVLSYDVGFCEYPTDEPADGVSYCTIRGMGLPDEAMHYADFKTNCAAQQQLIVTDDLSGVSQAAAQMNVSFMQLFDPTTLTPTTALNFEKQVSADVLPSRLYDYEMWTQQAARRASLDAGKPPPYIAPVDAPDYAEINGGTCTLPKGSILEAIHLYAADCEDNSRSA